MTIRYRVELSEAERRQLSSIVNGGKHAARKIKRAQILLAADGGLSEAMIARAVSVSEATVYRTKRRFVQGNLDLALREQAALVLRASCRARRRRCWWPLPAPARRPGASAGRWRCLPAQWSS
jgi:winged helix-turn helix protein